MSIDKKDLVRVDSRTPSQDFDRVEDTSQSIGNELESSEISDN